MDKEYEKNIRKKILEKIEDLKKKVKTNEPCPESPQSVDLLIHIDEALDSALQSWYY
jgi:hypothetical protein